MTRWHLEGSLDETDTVKKTPITKFPFVIGRSKSIDMIVLRSGISREHAEIINRDGRLFIRDLQSTNGTFVNKQRIDSEVLLTHNTTLHFSQFEFTLIDDEHKSSDEMLTVVVNVDEALGLHESVPKDISSKAPERSRSRPKAKAQPEVAEAEDFPDSIPVLKAESAGQKAVPSKNDDAGKQVKSNKPSLHSDDKVFIQGNWDESNRRLHARREVRWPVLVTLKNQQSIQCVTKDVSEVGIALKCPTNLREQTLVKLNISAFHKGKHKEIAAIGVVKHSLIAAGGFILGIQIKSCPDNSSEFLMKFSSRKI